MLPFVAVGPHCAWPQVEPSTGSEASAGMTLIFVELAIVCAIVGGLCVAICAFATGSSSEQRGEADSHPDVYDLVTQASAGRSGPLARRTPEAMAALQPSPAEEPDPHERQQLVEVLVPRLLELRGQQTPGKQNPASNAKAAAELRAKLNEMDGATLASTAEAVLAAEQHAAGGPQADTRGMRRRLGADTRGGTTARGR